MFFKEIKCFVKHLRTQMEFLLILQKRCSFNSVSCRNFPNEVKSCNLREEDSHMCTFSCIWATQTMLHSMQNGKGIIHCSQRGQPSHAAVEGDGRIILHYQLYITKCN